MEKIKKEHIYLLQHLRRLVKDYFEEYDMHLQQQCKCNEEIFTETLLSQLKRSHVHHTESNSKSELLLYSRDPFYSGLLTSPSESSINNEAFQTFRACIESTRCFPLYPLHNHIAKRLFEWIQYDNTPTVQHRMEQLEELKFDFTRSTKDMIPKLRFLLRSCESPSNDDVEGCRKVEGINVGSRSSLQDFSGCEENNIKASVCNLLSSLRKKDILALLGLRKTTGSLDILPPDLSRLWESFQMQHHVKSKLTVGARALTKHCHRSSEKWWGVCTGTEEEKNSHALEICRRILMDPVWINIHTLPHDTYVLEIRCSEGYGLRWTHDGRMFRGFLEPQMIDGHKAGWEH